MSSPSRAGAGPSVFTDHSGRAVVGRRSTSCSRPPRGGVETKSSAPADIAEETVPAAGRRAAKLFPRGGVVAGLNDPPRRQPTVRSRRGVSMSITICAASNARRSTAPLCPLCASDPPSLDRVGYSLLRKAPNGKMIPIPSRGLQRETLSRRPYDPAEENEHAGVFRVNPTNHDGRRPYAGHNRRGPPDVVRLSVGHSGWPVRPKGCRSGPGQVFSSQATRRSCLNRWGSSLLVARASCPCDVLIADRAQPDRASRGQRSSIPSVIRGHFPGNVTGTRLDTASSLPFWSSAHGRGR